MRKIAAVVTARPSYARIKSALSAIKGHKDLELILILAGSALSERYGNVAEVIRADGFEPAAEVHMLMEGATPLHAVQNVGLGLGELASVLSFLKPDCVLTIADRYETIATAIAAAYQNIPVAHVQGGEISGSIDEKVRHAVTKLSDIHFTATQKSAVRLIHMGEHPERVHHTGCPSIDLAAWISANDATIEAQARRYTQGGTGADLDLSDPYIIVMQHPVTYQWEQAGQQMLSTLEAIDPSTNCFWFWPNVDPGSDEASKMLRQWREQHAPGRMHFLRNVPPETFLWLLRHARAIAGNSSVAIREGSYLGTPAVNIGERQQGREMGRNVVNVVHDTQTIARAILEQSVSSYPRDRTYGDGTAGTKIADLLAQIELSTEKRNAY